MIRLAYICEPQLGGTFTFFLRLRPELLRRGIDMRCVTPLSEEQVDSSPFRGCDGVECVGCLDDDLAVATQELVDHLVAGRYDLVMILPGTDILSANLPAYLPRTIKAVIRVPMMTRGAYAPTRAIAPHLNRIYAVSDRIADDLVDRYGIDRECVSVIYHGIDPSLFDHAIDMKSGKGRIQLLYAGRLWDIDKGIFLLPDIMRRLKAEGVDAHLTVAGSGPDGTELKSRFERAGVADRVTMTGGLPLAAMQAQFHAADIFVFPSRFEGCGFAVLEAMAAGCAPVVADIRGSLRAIVDNGRSGVLARVGDAADFARGIRRLAGDRQALRNLQVKARERIVERFTLAQMSDHYAGSFRSVLASPDLRAPVRTLDQYKIPRALRPTWRTLVPRPVKNWVRTWLERVGVSS